MKFKYIKGTEKDFEGAPEWCTVVCTSNMPIGSVFYLESTKSGSKYKSSAAMTTTRFIPPESWDYQIIAQREPITESQSWYEKGELPQVGEVCEVKIGVGWHETEIVGVTKGNEIVFINPPELKRNHAYDSFNAQAVKYVFRPLKTKEQKEKEEITSALCDIWKNLKGIPDLSVISGKLYDMGWRKVDKQ